MGCKYCGRPIGSNSDCVWCEKMRSNFEDQMAEQNSQDIKDAYDHDESFNRDMK